MVSRLCDQVGGIHRAIEIEMHAPRLEAHELVDLIRERRAVQVMRQQEPPCTPVHQALGPHGLHLPVAVAAGYEQ